MSSTSSSSRQPAFVGQAVFHDAANWLQKKPSTSSPAQASSPATTALDASTSGTDPDKKVTSSSEAALGTVHCKYSGCSRLAKYRKKRDTTPIACQAHKRKGQYTINREGELLMATRDGGAFRTSDLEIPSTTAAVGCPPPASSDTSGTAASAFPRPSTGKSGTGRRSSAPSRRKQTAKISTPPANTFKGPKRPGLSIEGDRRCLFPGCDAQSGYGLPGAARAVYCFSHKKGSMVYVSKTPLDFDTRGSKRKIATSVAAAVDGKAKDKNKHKKTAESEALLTLIIATLKAAAATSSRKKGKSKTWRKPKVEGTAGEGCSDAGGERRMEISCAEEEKFTMDLKSQERIDPKLESLSPSASSVMARVAAEEQASTTGTINNSTQGNAATTTPPPPPSANRMADTSGMAPSVEMLLLQQAREAAKKEARASGRRPRAPSRRALEASGKMQGGGAQWMTREKRAEEARMMAKLREQRKLYKEAGLKFGVVVEALMEPATAMSGDGGKAGDGGSGGVEPARRDPDWQKVPAALLVAAPHLQPVISGAGDRPEKRARPNSAENKHDETK